MASLPDLPDEWTHGASVAYLLLGVAIIDGKLHDEETQDVYERLQRHTDWTDEVLHASVNLAWGYLRSMFSLGGIDLYMDSLQAHGDAIRQNYNLSTRKALLDDILSVAESDGEVAHAEIAYIAAVSGHLGLNDD
ncbi:MAG: putative tellurite resistance protein B-like protein [Kiritimatiellia bacterium]|jgi:uncharacterized tellurite resistance protein B-like protein